MWTHDDIEVDPWNERAVQPPSLNAVRRHLKDWKLVNRGIGESRFGEKLTPGRSTPLDLSTTEDHDATCGAKRHELDRTAYAPIAGTVKGATVMAR